MKRIIIALMGLMAIAACTEKLSDGGGETESSFKFSEEAVAGSEFIIQSEKFVEDKTKLYLGDTELGDILIMSSGLIVNLPYTLGTFDLSVEIDGAVHRLGELDIVLEAEVRGSIVKGSELSFVCNGLAEDFKLFLGNNELECSVSNGTVSTVINAEVGSYDLKVVQAGTLQVLVEKFYVGNSMAMESFALGMGTSTSFQAYCEYRISYDDGVPENYSANGTDYAVSIAADSYTFASDSDSFSYVIENGRVKTLVVDGESYQWEYDTEGHLTVYRDTFKRNNEPKPFYWGWTDGNLVSGSWSSDSMSSLGVAYEDETLLNNVQTDYAMLANINANLEDCDYYLAAAALLGLCGTPSDYIPSHYVETDEDGMPYSKPYTITWNASAYPEYIKGGETTLKCTYVAK